MTCSGTPGVNFDVGGDEEEAWLIAWCWTHPFFVAFTLSHAACQRDQRA